MLRVFSFDLDAGDTEDLLRHDGSWRHDPRTQVGPSLNIRVR